MIKFLLIFYFTQAVFGEFDGIAQQIAQHYPVSLHGVSLNIAGQSLNRDYLKKLKAFAHELKPVWVSDHLCWTGSEATNTHNLLPFAWTQNTLQHLVSQIQEVQSLLERQLVLENISAYVQFKDSELSEPDFLSQLCQQSGCLLLLDINNLYVNACNYQFDPIAFLKSLPAASIVQYHLAGYAEQPGFLFDSHSQAVWPAVWKLYQQALQIIGPRPTLIEWDENVPEFDVLEAEALKAKDYLRACV